MDHPTDRAGPGGYLCARRCRALQASPEYLTFFVAETPAVLACPGYLGLVQRISPLSYRVRAGFRDVARNTVLVVVGHCLGVGVVALALRSRGGALAPLLAELAQAQGVVAVHALQAVPDIRARMDAVRVTGLVDASTGDVLLVEALQAEDQHALRQGNAYQLERFSAADRGERVRGQMASCSAAA